MGMGIAIFDAPMLFLTLKIILIYNQNHLIQ